MPSYKNSQKQIFLTLQWQIFFFSHFLSAGQAEANWKSPKPDSHCFYFPWSNGGFCSTSEVLCLTFRSIRLFQLLFYSATLAAQLTLKVGLRSNLCCIRLLKMWAVIFLQRKRHRKFFVCVCGHGFFISYMVAFLLLHFILFFPMQITYTSKIRG